MPIARCHQGVPDAVRKLSEAKSRGRTRTRNAKTLAVLFMLPVHARNPSKSGGEARPPVVVWIENARGMTDERSESESMPRQMSRLRNFEVAANSFDQKFVDFSMSRNRRDLSRCAIHIDTVISTFAQKLAAMFLQMTDKIAQLHALSVKNGSRMTFVPCKDSSASMRFASSTN
jgi:arginyl-tRNA synthetase